MLTALLRTIPPSRPLITSFTRPFARSFLTTRYNMAPQRVEINIEPLADGTMKEVPFPKTDSESKILISKVQGCYYATSAKCTHYGAPLAKGVLTSDGRIICPWHGAAMSCKTGDIEDAPGLDNLATFKIESEGDKLFVTPPENGDVTATRQPPSNSGSKSQTGVVIVGGGAGAAHAVEALRQNGYEGSIKVISKEPYLPIDRTKLSKALLADPSKVALRSQDFYDKLGVEFQLNTEVESIDFDKSSVKVSGGNSVSYEKLILATGSNPNRIPVDGSKLGNIFVLRTIEDTKQINDALGGEDGPKKNVVVIGSSFIGMEAALAAAGKANVTVVGMENAPFEAILGKAIGNGIRKFHESKGTKFYLPGALSHFSASSSDSSKVGSVELKDGTSIPADLVVLGVGVKPATAFLKASGVELEKDGSVVVDEYLKLHGKENVFAVGDIATYKDVKTGKNTRVEHWNVASNHARNVAATIAGKSPTPYEKISVFWSAQGQQLRYAGTSRAKTWEDVIVQGSPEDLKFVAYYTAGEDVVAVASMQNDPIAAHCSELMRLNKMLSVKEIKDGKSPLDVKLVA
ncbi:hypothetical protein MVLG_00458 [Microbotryum lychnidis-dioicae p1A1 Lamole]|uniref:Rieske domain-containing protein n=1 Tax=Microbotryum lychnidis-dioicae (strain p1A1 Lamole / MvSl-1064) TaxID=683840 RepID=U5GZ54_USTV1|nr:hypothetical protein MVLG_00458 [Microbotryum lychnidis-dioicae p1A1 Lamole]|eukprot:KDE09563.1 hypothetical protein MVLG_00458 [Microbotryum lychnidis-dioicae p1A1 Lamole]